MADISHHVDIKSDANRDNVGFKNAQGVQQYIPKVITDPITGGIALSASGQRVNITTPRRACVVLLGDSITDMANGLRTTGAFSAPFSSSYWVWANAALGWRFDSVINAGVSGNTIVQMAARYDTDVAPYTPGVLILEGGTNDVLGTTAPNYEQKFTDAKAALREILAKALLSNTIVCLVTVGPLGSSVSATTDQLNQRARWNRYIRTVASTYDGVVLADWDGYLTDQLTNRPIGEADGKALIYTDNLVHPAGAGAVLMGKSIAEALRPFLGSNQSAVARGLTPNQFLTNPTFSGATGATAPTTWAFASLSTPSTSAVHTMESRSDGINAQQASVAMTAVGVMPSAQYQNFTSYGAGLLVNGDRVRCALEIDVYGTSTTDSQIGLYFAATTAGVGVVSDTNVMHDVSINTGGSTRVIGNSAVLPTSMVFVTDALTISATVAAFLIKIRLGGTQTFKLKSCVVFKVQA